MFPGIIMIEAEIISLIEVLSIHLIVSFCSAKMYSQLV